MLEDKPFKASENCTYGGDYVSGPSGGGECSYHGGPPYFKHLLATKSPAEMCADFANIGYREGYAQAQLEIRQALGLKG